MSLVSRRDLLLGGAASSAALGLNPLGSGLAGAVSTRAFDSERRTPSLRAAHITDVHIKNDKNAPKGVAAMFAHMFGQKEKAPELVLNTGDCVMAIDGNIKADAALAQIDLWKEATQACKAPIKSCLGNHDIWSAKDTSAKLPAEKKGAALMTEVLGMPAPYYSFDMGGWHFISLNSMCNWPNYGSLTPEHMTWLKKDLEKTPKSTPVCVLSHLPILSITSLVYGDSCRKNNDNLVPGAWQHADCWAITEVFRKHPQVKLCLSGHMHTCDRVEYRGVWYICGGAVSGAWWDGSEYGFPPCYGAIDLFADGTFDYRFVDYGWAARQWKGKQLAV